MSDIKSMEKATSKTSVFLPLSSVQQFASINNDNKSDIPLKKAESISICNPSVTQAQGFPPYWKTCPENLLQTHFFFGKGRLGERRRRGRRKLTLEHHVQKEQAAVVGMR